MKIRAKTLLTAFTIVEMMVSVVCSSLILGAIITAGAALQRSFGAVEGYSFSEGDQLRVQDYIAMDCRRASSVRVDNGSWISSGGTYSWVSDPSGPTTLILTLPAYYDSSGNVQAPSFGASSAIQYGNGATTTISYYTSGSSFMRQVGTDPTQCSAGATWTNCSKAIATNVNSFTVTPQDLTTKVCCTISFTPRFTTASTGAAGTIVYASTFLRNAAARY